MFMQASTMAVRCELSFFLLLTWGKKLHDKIPSFSGAERHQKSAYLILKKNNQQKESHAHQLIEDEAQQHHVENP